MPTWIAVENEIARLAATGETLHTVTGEENAVVGQVPNEHVVVTTKHGTDDIKIEHISTHWRTLETRRRVPLQALRRPGRRSGFTGALFTRISGIEVERVGRRHFLVIAD